MNGLQQLINQLCPNGVEWKTLGEVCEIKGRIGFRGYTRADQVEKGEGVISLSPANIIDGRLNYDDCTYITYFKYDESPEIKTYNGDIIFCKTASVGKIGLVENLPCEATINPQLVVLKEIKSNSRFLFYLLSANKFQSKVKALAGIGSVPNIGQAKLESIQIPLPPLAIQSRIVEILDHFTNLTANLTAELALRRKQFEHFREKLLALDGVEGVEMKKLGEVCEKVSKIKWGNIPQEDEFVYVDLTSVDIKSHSISTDYIITAENAPSRAQQIIKSDDILFATTRPTQMRYCIIPDNLNQQICSTGYCVIRANKNRALPRWILYLVSANEFSIFVNEHQQGAGYPSISDRVLFTFEIPLPPLAVQQSIVAKLDKFTALIQNIENELALRQKQYEYYREKLLSFPSPSL